MNNTKVVIFILFIGLVSIAYYLSLAKTSSSHLIVSPRNVFFDFGANNGDSVENFLGGVTKSEGGDIRTKIPAEKLNQKWVIYAVEGNPEFDVKLIDIQKKYKDSGHEIILYNSTIVAKYDGFIKFYTVGNRVGSSILANHPDVVNSKLKELTRPCVGKEY